MFPFSKRDKTAKKVRNVSKATKNLEIESKALYFPKSKIIPDTTRMEIDKSIGGKFENKGILVRRTPETKLTAAIVKVPVIKLTIKNIGKYNLFLALKPSSNDFPVDEVNLVPTNKNGYLNRFVINIKNNNENPYLAPAVVDDIKCEPPIAAPASKIPGPKLFCIPLDKFIDKFN